MNPEELFESIKKEITFETSRSSGKGGQHVNKTESRVTLVWNFMSSIVLPEELKAKLIILSHAYVSKVEIRISSEKTRSQFKNKADVVSKLNLFLTDAFKEKKPRKATKIPKSVIKKRLDDKNIKSKLKTTRKKINVKRGRFN